MQPTVFTVRARNVRHSASRIHNKRELLWRRPNPQPRRIVTTKPKPKNLNDNTKLTTKYYVLEGNKIKSRKRLRELERTRWRGDRRRVSCARWGGRNSGDSGGDYDETGID